MAGVVNDCPWITVKILRASAIHYFGVVKCVAVLGQLSEMFGGSG